MELSVEKLGVVDDLDGEQPIELFVVDVGISRLTYYFWLRRYEQPNGARTPTMSENSAAPQYTGVAPISEKGSAQKTGQGGTTLPPDARDQEESSVQAPRRLGTAGQEAHWRDDAEALSRLQEAVAILKQTEPDSSLTALALSRLGSIYRRRGELIEALDNHRQALEINRRLAPGSNEMGTDLRDIGMVYHEQGDLNEALRKYEQALAIHQGVDPESNETAMDLCNIGAIYQAQGYLDRALAFLEDALRINRLHPESAETANILSNIGAVHHAFGRLDQALNYYQQAREMHRGKASEPIVIARLLANIGATYLDRDDLDPALTNLHEALAILRRMAPQSHATGTTLTNIGIVYRLRGDPDRALSYYGQALTILSQVAPNSKETGSVLDYIGVISLERGDADGALTHFQQALEIHREVAPESKATAVDLNGIAHVYQARGDFDEALKYFQQALKIHRAVAPQSTDTATELTNIGFIHALSGQFGVAFAHYDQALSIEQRVAPDSREVAIVLSHIGIVHALRGDRAKAIWFLNRAVKVTESMRSRVSAGSAREGVLSQQVDTYYALIGVLHDRNHRCDRRRAFDVAERSRARRFIELLSEHSLELAPANEEQALLLQSEQQLQARLAGAYHLLAQIRASSELDPGSLTSAVRIESELADELEATQRKIRQIFPAYADLRYPKPIDLPTVQRMLPDDVLLLEYAIGGGRAFLWAIRHDHHAMLNLAMGSQEIADLANSMVHPYIAAQENTVPVAGNQEQPNDGDLARELGAALLGPIEASFWDGVQRVIIVPDGALNYVPFEMLQHPSGRGLVGERYILSYAPSATVLDALRRREKSTSDRSEERQFLGFGLAFDPSPREAHGGSSEGAATRAATRLDRELLPIRGARDEVNAIAAIFKGASQPYLDEEATEHRVKTSTGGYRFVHFATHGLFDDGNPLYSGLVLAPPDSADPAQGGNDDFLETYEMFGLDLEAAEAVVCSACETGRGHLTGGEGLVGMTRALHYAGARCVVVSLWVVADAPTQSLMERFYRKLRERVDPPDALHRAKEEVRRFYPDARDWAGFVLIGAPQF